ncbi:hypothetical protein BDV32DRAFT_125499 [Aspergillus pseudonomiae]|nr:hypothetical protein BDV32DRAFT_125499 [Aspergillus pseudonomiae]
MAVLILMHFFCWNKVNRRWKWTYSLLLAFYPYGPSVLLTCIDPLPHALITCLISHLDAHSHVGGQGWSGLKTSH